jgi:UDP-glucose 4-epimerase
VSTSITSGHLTHSRHINKGGSHRRGTDNLTCNCGYKRGLSVLEVIDVVKQVSGADFPVTLSARRAGDPAAIVASNETILSVLKWKPQYDDLQLIVRQAFEWERKLQERGRNG